MESRVAVHTALADPTRLGIVDLLAVSDAYAALIGDVGSRTQSAQFLSEVSTTFVQEAESVRDGEAGVNLDEEAARLLQFQQAYQASARILQVAQATFTELLGSIR